MDSAIPMYVLILIISVAMVFFKLGKNGCDNNHKIEYRFIPRNQIEMEENTTASDILSDFV